MRGKHLLAAGISCGACVLALLFLLYGYANTWKLWNIPVNLPCFADLRVITHGMESYALGYDPLLRNPQDPWERPMNYPRIWLLLHVTGVNRDHTVVLGVALIALFVASQFLYTHRELDPRAAGLLTLMLFSPAVLFCIERGNLDLLMFSILSLAIFIRNTRFNLSRVLSMALVFTAFFLKLFPIFGFGILLREKRRIFMRLGLFVLAVGLLYIAFTYDDLIQIRRDTPRSPDVSYGVWVLSSKVARVSPVLGEVTCLLSYVAAAGVALAVILGFREKEVPAQSSHEMALDAYRAGSGIYIGTFLLGHNFDYRLIFLLFTIPQLAEWLRSPNHHVALLVKVVVIAVLLSMWHLLIVKLFHALPGIGPADFVLDEFAHWAIFFGMAYLLSFSAPDWMKELVGRLWHQRSPEEPHTTTG
ncbi:MAG: hypothetical protein IT365_09825 [Candidatus Hydrogenedentes bacterium]|nr:hypothetical protein [Candidatus Hydrogenedentota bacterium]